MKHLIPIIEANNDVIQKCVALITDKDLTATVDSSNELGRLFGHITSSRNGTIGFLDETPIDLNWGEFGEFSMTAAFESKNKIPSKSHHCQIS